MSVGPIYLGVKVEFLTDLARNALVGVTSATLEVRGIVEARRTQNRPVAALEVGTVDHSRGPRPAVVTLADHRRGVAEGDGHPFVEHIQRALPQTFVAERFAVSDDAALDLVHLGEASIEHGGAENFASHTAGAIRDDGFGFEVVVLTAVQFGDEVLAGSNVGHDGVFETPDPRFEGVPPVEKHDVITTLGDEVVDLMWTEVGSAVQDTLGSDDDLVG